MSDIQSISPVNSRPLVPPPSASSQPSRTHAEAAGASVPACFGWQASGDQIAVPIRTPDGRPQALLVRVLAPLPFVCSSGDACLRAAVQALGLDESRATLDAFDCSWDAEAETIVGRLTMRQPEIPERVATVARAGECIIWCAERRSEPKGRGDTSLFEAIFLELQSDVDVLGQRIDRFGDVLPEDIKARYNDAYGDLRSALDDIRCQRCEEQPIADLVEGKRLCATCVEVEETSVRR